MRNFWASRVQKLVYAKAPPKMPTFRRKGGNSSVGRAQPCQGWGRGSESRFPLNTFWNKREILQLVLNQCPGGGIVRRSRFRCVCREACRFESCSGHSFFQHVLHVGEVAELVDALLWGGSVNCDVGVRVSSSSLSEDFAEIAQLVEHNLAKVGVAGPSPVFRSY